MANAGKKTFRKPPPQDLPHQPGAVVYQRANDRKIQALEARAKEFVKDFKFNVEAPGPSETNEAGKTVTLPPLLEIVHGMYHTHSRREMVRQLGERYQCSARTVDRCIAKVKEEVESIAALSRPQRIAKTLAAYEEVFRRGLRGGKFHAANQAKNLAHKLSGDYKVMVAPDDGRQPEALLAEAEALREALNGDA